MFTALGYRLYGMARDLAVNTHGVNINKMNEMLIKGVNSACGNWFVSGQVDEEHQFWLVYEQLGTGNVSELLQLLTDGSNKVLEMFYGNICGCKRHW